MKVNKKFIASATSAALVASAIVPVASAASFSDIENNTHKDAILALAEAGIISGYTDGTFKPNAQVTRGNVTKLLGKWLVTEGYEIPADYNTVERFTDVPVTHGDQELVKYAALVKDAKVFNGSNGQLLQANNMTREQMAVVLVRAINTVYGIDLIADYKAANFESEITDFNQAIADYHESITALEFAGLTTQKTFNPKGTVTRGQFASFLNRAIEYAAKQEVAETVEVESVTAVNGTITVTLKEKAEKVDVKDFTVTQAINGGEAKEVTPSKAELAEDGKTVTLTVEKVAQTDAKQSVVYTVNKVAAEAFVVEAEAAFKVAVVTAITTTSVDVTFEALTEDIKDATIEVKNSKGTVVAVKAQDLKKGSKSASFDFETAVTKADLVGEWTVDGVKYSFTEKEQVEDIKNAASLVLLGEALKTAGIENVNDDLMQAYKVAIADAEVATLADVQKAIDSVNSSIDAVKAVVDADTEIKLFNALKAGFENVESKFATDYQNALVTLNDDSTTKTLLALNEDNYIGTNGVTAKEIQAAIDRTNTYAAAQAVAAANGKQDATKTAEAKALLSLVQATEDGKVGLKDWLTDLVKHEELITSVTKATTKTSFMTALTKLDEFETEVVAKYKNVSSVPYVEPTTLTPKTLSVSVSDDLKIENVKADYAQDYIDYLATLAVDDKNQRSDINTAITTVNGNITTALLADINKYAATATKDEAALLKTLKKYPGLVQVVDANKAAYFATINNSGSPETVTTSNIQQLVDKANLSVVAAATDESKVLEALKVFGLDNVKDEYAAQYLADKATIGNSDNATTNDNADTLKAIKADIETSNAVAVKTVQVKAINEAKTAAEVKAALDELAIAEYIGVPTADRLYIAERVLEVRDSLLSTRKAIEIDSATVKAQNSQPSVTAKEFANYDDLVAYIKATAISEVIVDQDLNGDSDKDDASLKSVIGNYTAAITAVNNITYGGGYQALAEVLDLYKIGGFDGNGVSAAESTKAEKLFDTLVFAQTSGQPIEDGAKLVTPFKSLSAVATALENANK